MKAFLIEKALVIVLTLATAPLGIFFILRGRIRFAVLASALTVAILVLGSRTIKWAVGGAMTGASTAGLGAWAFVVGVPDDASDNAVLVVLFAGFLGVLAGTVAGARLAQRTADFS